MRLYILIILICSFKSFAQQNQFVQIASLPIETSYAYSYNLNGEIYVGGGGNYSNQFYKYDDQNNNWIQMANMPISPIGGFSFALNNKAYIGGGLIPPGVLNSSVWSYDPILNSWSQEINFPGTNGYNPSAFSINDKGFVVCGNSNGQECNLVWCFDASQNSWVQKQNFPGMARSSALGISDQSSGYIIGGGGPQICYNEIWKYNLLSDSWQILSQFSAGRTGMTGFYLNNYIYFGTGICSGPNSTQFEKINCSTGQISSISNSPIAVNGAIGNATGNYGYFGTGWNSPNSTSLMYKYIPCESTNTTIDTVTCNSFIYNDFTYQQSSIIIDTLQSINGCDSILTLNLTINFGPNVPIIYSDQQGMLYTQNQQNATYQWHFCSDNIQLANEVNDTLIPPTSSLYYVTVQNQCGIDTSDCYFYEDVSIQEWDKSIFKIFPNPCSKTIQIESKYYPTIFSILNYQGQLVSKILVENKEQYIDVDFLECGVNFFTDGVNFIRFVKE
jgi:N-acetylneuraminic acid mutarotase